MSAAPGRPKQAKAPPGGSEPRAAGSVGAILLAAGRGERMRPLTDTCPKPLLPVRGKPLMQWPLEALLRAGITRVVVNTAWLEPQIPACFGDFFAAFGNSDKETLLSISEQTSAPPRPPGIHLSYSHEGRDFGGALETAGGIARALPQLPDVFWVLAGDVFAPDFVFDPAAAQQFAAGTDLAHLWLVPNPPHNPKGDFGLSASGRALNDAAPGGMRHTYSTMALVRAALFAPPFCAIPPGNPAGIKAPLAPLLRAAIAAGRVGATLYPGAWTDVGTPERLAALNT